jgi:hypothetical protein
VPNLRLQESVDQSCKDLETLYGEFQQLAAKKAQITQEDVGDAAKI